MRLIHLVVVGLAMAANARADVLAVVGGTVIDGTGGKPIESGVLVIENKRIVAVGGKSTAIPQRARRIDATGKYVVPGLMDAHVHLCAFDLETLVKYEGRYREVIMEAAQFALRGGVTTVFDTWGPRTELIKARDSIDAGEQPGSRIYLAGTVIGWSGPLGADFSHQLAASVSPTFVSRLNESWEEGAGRKLLWQTPDEVRAVVAQYVRKNIDFLKYAGTQHHDPHPYLSVMGPDLIPFSPRVQRAIVEEGHKAGLTVQAHTTSVESLNLAAEAGVDILSHGDLTGPTTVIPQDTIRMLAQRGTVVVVRPFTQRHLEAQQKTPGWPYGPLMQNERTNQLNLIRGGVRILVSTDGGVPSGASSGAENVDPRFDLGEGHFNALVGLEELGMDRMEILKSATAYVAKAYRMDDKIGTLQPGRAADLLILDANPLASARNYRSINTLIKDGAIVDRAALPTRRLLTQ